MITTAALAWKNLGLKDFRKHVLVFFSPSELTLPTLLIKMTPWTADEVAQLSAYLAPPELEENARLVVMENPLDPSKSFLSDDFYSGSFPSELAERMPVDSRRAPTTTRTSPSSANTSGRFKKIRRTSSIRAPPLC